MIKAQKLTLLIILLLNIVCATDILDLPLTARQAAVANSFTTHPATTYSTIANPAALTNISQNEFEILQNRTNELANYYYSGLLFKTPFAPLGISYAQLRVDDLKETSASLNASGEVEVLGDLSYQTSILTLGSGYTINDWLSCGINYKYLKADLSADYPQAKGYSLGVGFLANYSTWKLGFMIDNLSSQIKYSQNIEKLPLAIKTALFKNFKKFSSIFEYQKTKNNNGFLKAGIIYQLTKNIELLAGYQQQRISLGISYHFNNITLDYAYVTKANQYTEDESNVSLRVNW